MGLESLQEDLASGEHFRETHSRPWKLGDIFDFSFPHLQEKNTLFGHAPKSQILKWLWLVYKPLCHEYP